MLTVVKAYINLQLNRKRWDRYLKKEYWPDVDPDTQTDEQQAKAKAARRNYSKFRSWASNPKSEFLLKFTLKRYTDPENQIEENIEERQGIVNLIVPRSDACDLAVESSTASNIKNFYREIRVFPDIGECIAHRL